jgi:hypothetical protein
MFDSLMTTRHLKTGVEPASKMSFISNIPQTMDNVNYSNDIVEYLRRF